MFDTAAMNDILLPIFLFVVYFSAICCFLYWPEQSQVSPVAALPESSTEAITVPQAQGETQATEMVEANSQPVEAEGQLAA